jgi:hypothetical protein
MTEHDAYYDILDKQKELADKLKAIYEEQENRNTPPEYTTVGNIYATRDKHAAILLILDAMENEDVAFWFDQIR